MSVGGGSLSFSFCVILLFNGDMVGYGPVHVTPQSVGPSSIVLVGIQFVGTRLAVVVGADGTETMGVAVGAHVVKLLHLGFMTCSTGIAAVPAADVWVDVFTVLFHATLLCREFCKALIRPLICTNIASNWVFIAWVLAAWSLLAAALLKILAI